MRKLATFAIIVALVVAAFIVGSRWNRKGSSLADKPQEELAPTSAAVSPDATEEALAPGTINISPEKRQLVGIRIAEVRKEPLTHTLRVLGRVAADETRLFIINAATSGWIMQIAPVTPGAMVKKGDVLSTFYAPELLGAQQSYLYGLNTQDRLKEGEGQPQPSQLDSAQVNIAQYRDALRNLGMSDQQLDEIAERRERVQQVDMRSPTTGIVVWRNIFPGLKFVQGTEFFRIADLSRVWIYLDVFENETRYLKPGVRSKVSLTGQQMDFEAVVSNVLPLFDPSTRTMKVRLEAENPRYALRPDMFVDVELPIELQSHPRRAH